MASYDSPPSTLCFGHIKLLVVPCPYPSILFLYKLLFYLGILYLPVITALPNSTPPLKAWLKHHLLLDDFLDSQPLVPPPAEVITCSSLRPHSTTFGVTTTLSRIIVVYTGFMPPARLYACWRDCVWLSAVFSIVQHLAHNMQTYLLNEWLNEFKIEPGKFIQILGHDDIYTVGVTQAMFIGHSMFSQGCFSLIYLKPCRMGSGLGLTQIH